MLYIFDLDGTLVRGVNGIKIPNKLSQQDIIPGVLERCKQLRAEGHRLAIASNQGGVAFGYCTLEEADERIAIVAKAIKAPYRFCPYHPKGTVEAWRRESPDRKPNPGMLTKIMRDLQFSPSDTCYIGDMDTDQEAARSAGIQFRWADEFFGWARGE